MTLSHITSSQDGYAHQIIQITLPLAHLVHGLTVTAVCMQISSPEEASCDLTLPLNSSDPASYLRQLCSAGYYGPVCSLCVKTDDKRYGRAGPLQCQKCKSNAVILLAYIISTLLVLAWLSYTVYVTLEENEEAAAGSTDPGRTSQIIRVCPPAESHRGHDHVAHTQLLQIGCLHVATGSMSYQGDCVMLSFLCVVWASLQSQLVRSPACAIQPEVDTDDLCGVVLLLPDKLMSDLSSLCCCLFENTTGTTHLKHALNIAQTSI